MNVLSLFDGISCGQIALERAGIKVDTYYASEIEESSIKITMKNYPNTIELGDILKLNTNSLPKIDLLIGGSPCQSFSFAGKQKGMSTKDNIKVTTLEQYLTLKNEGFQFEGQSYLFWEYIRTLKEIKPTYFLLENVKMAKEWQDIITKALGVKPIKINSSLVSAQKRERLYWTNIPNIEQPTNKNIMLNDILQNDIIHNFLPEYRQEYTNYDVNKIDKLAYPITAIQLGSSKQFKCSTSNDGKAFTLRKTECNGIIDENLKIRKYTPIEAERLQTIPDDYTLCDGVSKTRRYEAVGNGWTVDVIAHILSYIKNK